MQQNSTCKVYNSVGSQKMLFANLRKEKITDFNSLDEILDFKKKYPNLKNQINFDSINAIKKEYANLESAIDNLTICIKNTPNELQEKFQNEVLVIKNYIENHSGIKSNNLVNKAIFNLKKAYYKIHLFVKKQTLQLKIKIKTYKLANELKRKKNRHLFITDFFDKAVEQHSKKSHLQLNKKFLTINNNLNLLYGAIGELKVENELKKLSDDYILINDYYLIFPKAFYYYEEKEYIKSIQIDHLLISPAGIFVIETKNWSENSINNTDFWSPVKQVRRLGFAIYKIVSEELIHKLGRNPWGDRRIPVRNIVVFTGAKPNEDFQFVRILNPNELRNYINYFKPIFSKSETEIIANYMLKKH